MRPYEPDAALRPSCAPKLAVNLCCQPTLILCAPIHTVSHPPEPCRPSVGGKSPNARGGRPRASPRLRSLQVRAAGWAATPPRSSQTSSAETPAKPRWAASGRTSSSPRRTKTRTRTRTRTQATSPGCPCTRRRTAAHAPRENPRSPARTPHHRPRRDHAPTRRSPSPSRKSRPRRPPQTSS